MNTEKKNNMIQKISFQNYKAFEKGEIKLKPITILLGANSVGKSSIINLLLMLQQTANSTNYKSAVSMGECENIFRNKVTKNNIIVDFEFKDEGLKELLKKDLFNDFIGQLFQPIEFLSRFPEETVKKDIEIEINQFINKRREIDDRIYHSKDMFLKLFTAIETLNTNIYKNRKQSDIIRYYSKRNEVSLNNKKNIEQLYDFLIEMKKNIKNDMFSLSFELCFVNSNKKEDVLKIHRMSLKQKEKTILNIQFTLNKNNSAYDSIDITSDFVNGQEILDIKAKNEFLRLISYDSTIFSWSPRVNRNRDFFFRNFDDSDNSIITHIISLIIGYSMSAVKSQFTRELINHVSPLRAHPKRYYFLDKANINTVLDTLDGNSLTEVLKENETVKNRVNTWLNTFGLQVDVSTLQDVIHKLKIHQYTLDLDITDVGFGISQILPVIVQGFLSFDGSLTMIEQPEIHLHPKMQADLADLFIDVVMGVAPQKTLLKKQQPIPKKYLLVETHSEYLLRRLRRRISEGKISAEDVAIYFITPPKDNNSSSEIQEKEISEDGNFEWPQDFYADELKKDTTEFIKQLFRKK